ncbi:MAG: methyltransferase domain-containing protein [Bryobacteraceae bacterium]
MPGSAPNDWDSSLRPFLEQEAGDPWRAYCDQLHEQMLDEWLPGDRVRRVLKTDLFDEAAGAGVVATLSSRADQVHAFDVSGPVAAQASKRNPAARVTSADVRRLPYRDGSFDLIFSNSTLDHFPTEGDVVQAVAELHRVLRAGGRLWISFDNLANPVIALRAALPIGWLNRIGLVPYFVGKTVTRGGLSRLLTASGFTVERLGYAMHVPRVLAVPICARLRGRPEAVARWHQTFRFFEGLERWPVRRLTGHFVVALATKPDASKLGGRGSSNRSS